MFSATVVSHTETVFSPRSSSPRAAEPSTSCPSAEPHACVQGAVTQGSATPRVLIGKPVGVLTRVTCASSLVHLVILLHSALRLVTVTLLGF